MTTDDYHGAVADLGTALSRTWRACEVAGTNLPEALSYALALAARELVHEAVGSDLLALGDHVLDQDLATGVLVLHRPGSWEATHVVELTYPVDLLPETDGPAQP